MTYEEWLETYKPIHNHIDENASYEGTMFETYGDELAEIRRTLVAQPGKVWTLISGDGSTVISDGFHLVNRLGYFITEVAFEPADGVQYLEILIDEDGDEDDDRCLTPGCTEDANNGEGFDGYCGSCADRREATGEGIES